MFGHKHYVPILKNKRGEYSALENSVPAVRDSMTPLIEISTEDPKKTLEARVKDVPSNMAKAWPGGRFFMDVPAALGNLKLPNGAHALEWVVAESRKIGGLPVPVIGLDRNAQDVAIVKRIAANMKSGVCVRLTMNDLGDPVATAKTLPALLKTIAVPAKETDLVIDAGILLVASGSVVALAVNGLLNQLAETATARSITFASTSFPQAAQSRKVSRFPRADWATWRHLNGLRGTSRLVSFADYGIQYPEITEFDPKKMTVAPQIRYSSDLEWIVLKGGAPKFSKAGQPYTLAGLLVAMPEFSGAGFSWGDLYIHERSQKKGGPGNSSSWRAVGFNHHMAKVSVQLSKLP